MIRYVLRNAAGEYWQGLEEWSADVQDAIVFNRENAVTHFQSTLGGEIVEVGLVILEGSTLACVEAADHCLGYGGVCTSTPAREAVRDLADWLRDNQE